MAPCQDQVSGKAEKLKAEKILLDVTRFAEERAGTQLARQRKEQEALAARERIEAQLLQELVVASERAADHSNALQAAAIGDTAPPAALQAQALALERRVLVKDREWKQVHASESRMAELERQLEDEQKETKASWIALLELDRALAEYEGAHRTCAELGEQNAVERERCDSESERLEAAKRGLEAARLASQQARKEEARALSQRQAAEARGRAAERAIELAELARSRAAEAAGRARAEAEVAAGESGAVRAQLASARRELGDVNRELEAAQAAARLAAAEAEAAMRAVQRLRAQEQADEATAPLEEEDPRTALAREQALLRNQTNALRAARLDLQMLAEELAALNREEARLQSENAARAGEAVVTKARYAAARERFHVHEALLYRALLDKSRARSALERERPSRSAERALEAGVRSLEAQLEGARRSLRAASEGASRAKQERGSAQVAKDAEAHAVQAEEALLRTELQSLVALEASLQIAQRRAAGALIRLEIWRLHAHANAQQLLSSEEGLEMARAASDEARRAARDRLREAAQRVAQLQAHLAQSQTTLRPLLHELRALQLQALKDQLAAEQAAERELALQIEAARQGVAALEDAIAQGQSANQELASQAM
ncbi:hypothetical protein QBZ16_003908 [Prototheca wickerhamii]|uniref:Uncharacterized protein n=1 Tax=Prototheca wickerhamii TaxID=3111 RepID=A0AAD9IIY5_PROWI|nr:hypothetical protein QBZ16_003908 [Prototheca wickerhamii]